MSGLVQNILYRWQDISGIRGNASNLSLDQTRELSRLISNFYIHVINSFLPNCHTCWSLHITYCDVFQLSTTGCNIGCKTSFSEQGKLFLRLTCPAGTSTCPATLLNKGEIGLGPKHTCRAGQVRVLFSLPHCRFLPN